MSPIEYIEEGIKKGNWTTVCEGYERLTGKPLSCPTNTNWANVAIDRITEIIETANIRPKKKVGRPKKKENKPQEEGEDKEDETLVLDGVNTPVARETGKVQLITNEPSSEEISDNKIRAKRSKGNKAKLDRKVNQKFKVKCNECEQEFESDRKSGQIGQKCSKCLSGRKDRFT